MGSLRKVVQQSPSQDHLPWFKQLNLVVEETATMTDNKQRPDCFDFAMDFLGDPEASEILAYVEELEARAALANSARLRTERRFGPFGEWTALVPCGGDFDHG
jgi:hypothetical protein